MTVLCLLVLLLISYFFPFESRVLFKSKSTLCVLKVICGNVLKFQKFCFLPLPTYTDNYGTRSFDGRLSLQNIESSGTWVFEHAPRRCLDYAI